MTWFDAADGRVQLVLTFVALGIFVVLVTLVDIGLAWLAARFVVRPIGRLRARSLRKELQ